MIRTCRTIKDNWRKNHRHQGGIRAVGRCLVGTLGLRSGLMFGPRQASAAIEVLTFSVVPWLTVLWAHILRSAFAGKEADLLIGDCSGGLGEIMDGPLDSARIRVIPCLNDHHGDKLDLFLAKLCRAPYVVIADDDVFWLSAEPLDWALSQFDADPRVAVVSLMPRRAVSSVLERDDVRRPMGSHCLVVRRDLWCREGLSFAVAPSPVESDDWFYDTGDLANRELLRRGNRVVIAPTEIEDHLVAFDAVSSWVLKLQGLEPDRLEKTVADVPIRQQKALRTICFARALPRLVAHAGLASSLPEVVPESRLAAAQAMLETHMPAADLAAGRREIEEKVSRLATCLPHVFDPAKKKEWQAEMALGA